MIFGLRELNSGEQRDLCSNRSAKTDLPLSHDYFSFSFDYRLRTYLSGCYYLDENNYWQSGGLVVREEEKDQGFDFSPSDRFRLVH